VSPSHQSHKADTKAVERQLGAELRKLVEKSQDTAEYSEDRSWRRDLYPNKTEADDSSLIARYAELSGAESWRSPAGS
jgi:hypothetical protein